ncbi:MAG: Flp pilus assembly protein CpaB [Deltaproteobacteria bacterium]
MLKGSRKYWFIAVVCGLVTAMLAYRYITDLKASYSPHNLVQVVVARERINRDTLITRSQVKLAAIPAQYVNATVPHQIESVLGKTAAADILAGEQVLMSRLVSSADKSERLSYAVPPEKRAVSIAIDSISGVAGYIKAGDRVDIVATIDVPTDEQGSGNARPFSILTLQNIEVLAVGENLELADKKKSAGSKSLTLAVKVEDALPLIMASERGNLRLLLRSPVDKSTKALPPFQIRNLLGTAGS